jgi:hypothetical protein
LERVKGGREETNDKVFIELLALLLLRSFQSKSFHFIRNTQSCDKQQKSDSWSRTEREREAKGRTIKVEFIHSTEISLGLSTEKANTIRFTTITFLGNIAFQNGRTSVSHLFSFRTLHPMISATEEAELTHSDQHYN